MLGQGRKINQDFHAACVPKEPQLSTKGIAIALADGISSSAVSRVAAESAVNAFVEDYYCTSEAWSVRTSAERVLVATNSWLHAQTQASPYRYDREKGYVSTFSGVVIKSTTAHLFHVGDARICRLHGTALEQLTEDHRVWVSAAQSYLARAMGLDRRSSSTTARCSSMSVTSCCSPPMASASTGTAPSSPRRSPNGRMTSIALRG